MIPSEALVVLLVGFPATSAELWHEVHILGGSSTRDATTATRDGDHLDHEGERAKLQTRRKGFVEQHGTQMYSGPPSCVLILSFR